MRYVLAPVAATLITLTLFYVLHVLATRDPRLGAYDADSVTIDLVRLLPAEEAERRDRLLREKPPPPKAAPAPPQPQVAKAEPPSPPRLDAPAPQLATPDLSSGPWLGEFTTPSAAPAAGVAPAMEGDVVPLVRIAPQYPRRAAMKGTEGWVKLEFTILEDGTVTDVDVIDADPKRVFDTAAKKAILRWKFKPLIVDGKAQQRRATQVIDFKLN